jgi:predicted transcriptional regulator
VSYRPSPIDRVIELRARVVDAGERRATVTCHVLQDGDECAVAEVITVRTKTKE